jgi:TRAF3-interacting protein 1
MTEKLLSRPPFRYIHDIISATIEKTGWGAGLLIGEEGNSKAIEDKDQKIFILQKVLDLT